MPPKPCSTYCIVSFLNEDGVISLIPSIWLTTDKKECFWPPYPAGTAIKKCLVPSEAWTKVPVNIIEDEIDTYARGLRHQKRAEDDDQLQTTDVDTPVSRLRGRKRLSSNNSKVKAAKRPSFSLVSVSPDDGDLSSNSSALSSYVPLDDDDDDKDLLRRLDALKNCGNQSENRKPESPLPNQVQGEGYFVTQTDINSLFEKLSGIEKTLIDIEKRQEVFEKTVLREVATIKSDVKEVQLWIKTQEHGNHQRLKDDLSLELPLASADSLRDAEQLIADELNHTKLVSLCSTFGGSDVKKIVRKILSNLISPDLSKKINFIGVNGKIEFRSLRLKRVVLDATRANPGKSGSTEFEIDEVIKKWFQNSRDLNGGRTARKEKSLEQDVIAKI